MITWQRSVSYQFSLKGLINYLAVLCWWCTVKASRVVC